MIAWSFAGWIVGFKLRHLFKPFKLVILSKVSLVNLPDPCPNQQSTATTLDTPHNPSDLFTPFQNLILVVPAADTMSQLEQQMTSAIFDNWEGFIMDKSNRKLLLKTSDFGKRYRKVKSKVKFLHDCLKFKVIPPTCRSKHTPPVLYTSHGQNEVNSIQKKASIESMDLIWIKDSEKFAWKNY